MLLKIIIYIFVIAGFIIIERLYGLFSNMGITRGSHILLILFCLYLLLLYLEIRANKKRGQSANNIKRKCFIISFWIGVTWGPMWTFSAGLHYKIGLLELILILIGWAISGALFGLIGYAISNIFIRRKEME